MVVVAVDASSSIDEAWIQTEHLERQIGVGMIGGLSSSDKELLVYQLSTIECIHLVLTVLHCLVNGEFQDL